MAEALRRPGVEVDAQLRLTDGTSLRVTIVIPDPVGTIAMKTLVRTARDDARDVDDLWRCLEIAAAAGIAPADFDGASLRRVREELWRQLGPDGVTLSMLVGDLQPDAAARLRTRVRALLAEVVGAADHG